MFWEGLERESDTGSGTTKRFDTVTYLEGTANTCKGTRDFSLSYIRVNLEMITVLLGAGRHPQGSLKATGTKARKARRQT